jgi:Fe-S-cluster containining protein
MFKAPSSHTRQCRTGTDRGESNRILIGLRSLVATTNDYPRSMSLPIPDPEWFTRADAPEGGQGLRFGCTMCGNCCSGPPGFVLVTDAEVSALARRLGVDDETFKAQYTHIMSEGRSLNEKPSPFGNDCVFLDREKIPGKAVCGVYEDRPIQCRTWPFWPSLLKSRGTWEAAKRTCPGIDKGELIPVEQVRLRRDSFRI